MESIGVRQRKVLSTKSKSWILNVLKSSIILYQRVFSKLLHFISLGTVGGGCRFYPSCSEYSIQALDKYGVHLRSFTKIGFRLLRCQPLIKFKNKKSSGYDPVD